MLKGKGILVFLLVFGQVFGQGLKGVVLDSETNKPVAYAALFLTDIEVGTTANEEGVFLFENEIPNHNKLQISALGYSQEIVEINEETNRQNFVVKLAPTHYHLHETVISAGTGELQNYAITPVATKPLSELNTLPQTNLGEAIANLEGVYNASTGKGIYKPVIRGFSGIRVLSFVDGVRLENQQWGGDHGLGVSTIGVGDVEVIKGPSSLLYGADALGGVLYLKSEPFAQSNSIEASVSSQFETNTKGIKNGVAFKLSKNNFRLNVFANQQSFADYQVPDGKFVKTSRFKGTGAKIVVGYNKKKWVSKLSYNYSNNVVGIPGHTHDTMATLASFLRTAQVREEGRPSQKIKNHLISFDNQFFFHNSTLKVTLGQGINRLEEYEKFTIPEIGIDLSSTTYYIRYKYKLTNNLSLISGAQGLYQENANLTNAETTLMPNNSQFDNGVFGILSGKHKKLNYQFGVRFDNRQLSAANEKKLAYNSVNYSAGASYVLHDFSFSLNLSSGVRAPHVSELFSKGGHSAVQRYEIGDASLKPEIGNQIDFSVKYQNEHLDILLNPFVNIVNNYIYLQPDDSVVNGYQVYYYKQAAQTMLAGGEAVFHYHPHFLHHFHLESTFSYVYAENKSKKPLSFIPQPRLATQIIYDFDHPHKHAFFVKNITLQHQFFANQNRVVAFELPSSQYHLINMGINTSIKTKAITADLGFGVNNLLNQSYIDHLSALKIYRIPNPGRNFYISLKLNINQKIK